MYNLQDIANEYHRLDQIFNIDTSDIDLVHFTGVSQCGYCCVKNGRPIKIGINDLVFECPENEFYDVIRHEYAHAVDAVKYKNRGHARLGNKFVKLSAVFPRHIFLKIQNCKRNLINTLCKLQNTKLLVQIVVKYITIKEKVLL